MKKENAKLRYDFLVLMDFSEASYKALKYVISMSKLIRCNIHVFHVANVGEIITTDNQSVALRAIESETRKIERKLDSIVEIIKAEGIPATSQYSLGNIINELETKVDNLRPDLVVIGKKKKNTKLSGKLTSYLMNKYAGSLLLVEKEIEFQPGTKISIGYNDEMLHNYAPLIVLELDKHTKSPLTLLTVRKSDESDEQISTPKVWQTPDEKDRNIHYKNLQAPTIVNGLVKYISQNNIELLCIGRGKTRSFFQNLFFSQSNTMSEIINEVQMPILLMRYNPTSRPGMKN